MGGTAAGGPGGQCRGGGRLGLLLLWADPQESRLARVGRAALGAGVLATTPGWIGWGRTATTDMFLSSAITLALFGYLVAERDPSSGACGASAR